MKILLAFFLSTLCAVAGLTGVPVAPLYATNRNAAALAAAVFPPATNLLTGGYCISCVGDSLVAGAQDNLGDTFPNVLATNSNFHPVNNMGVGGQTSTQIAVRDGAVPTTVTVAGSSIPTSGGVTITFATGFEPVTAQSTNALFGTISNVYGKAVYLSGSTATFTRSTNGTAVTITGSVPFVVDNSYTAGLFDGPFVAVKVYPGLPNLKVYQMGRNNFAATNQVMSDISACASQCIASNIPFLFLSILNATNSTEWAGTLNHDIITNLNWWMSTNFPKNYLDTRTYLVGLTNTSYAMNDTIDPAFRVADGLHLNVFGYVPEGNLVWGFISNNFLAKSPQSYNGSLTLPPLSGGTNAPFNMGDISVNSISASRIIIPGEGEITTSGGVGFNFISTINASRLTMSGGNLTPANVFTTTTFGGNNINGSALVPLYQFFPNIQNGFYGLPFGAKTTNIIVEISSNTVASFTTNGLWLGNTLAVSNSLVTLQVNGSAQIDTNVIIGGTLTVGGATNTASGTVVNTNWVSGQLYTNFTGRPIMVTGSVTLTTAAIAGYSQMALSVPGAVTNYATVISAVAGLTGTMTNAMSPAFVPSLGTFTWTNSSSGVGDASGTWGGQYIVY